MTENHAVKITNGISGCDKNVYTIVHELMNIKGLCVLIYDIKYVISKLFCSFVIDLVGSVLIVEIQLGANMC